MLQYILQNWACKGLRKPKGIRSVDREEEETEGSQSHDFSTQQVATRRTEALFTRRYVVHVYKLHQKRLGINIRKKYFTVGTINHWDNLLREMVESLLLKVFKM